MSIAAHADSALPSTIHAIFFVADSSLQIIDNKRIIHLQCLCCLCTCSINETKNCFTGGTIILHRCHRLLTIMISVIFQCQKLECKSVIRIVKFCYNEKNLLNIDNNRVINKHPKIVCKLLYPFIICPLMQTSLFGTVTLCYEVGTILSRKMFGTAVIE